MPHTNHSPTLLKTLLDWIANTNVNGGVYDDGYDTFAAITALTRLCNSVHERHGHTHNELSQLGFKWIAAFTVSCCKHGKSDPSAIFAPARFRQHVFAIESQRNTGILHTILEEAANIAPRLFESAMAATFATLIVAPTGRGKGVGRIMR